MTSRAQQDNGGALRMSASSDLAETPLALAMAMADRFWQLQARYGHHGSRLVGGHPPPSGSSAERRGATMTDPEGTVLRGLPGDNPLGFLAALGVQVALDDQGGHHRLHWTDDPIPRPVVSPALDYQDVANAALAVGSAWLDGPALDEAIEPKLKLRRPHIRDYLRRGRDAGSSGALALCLLAEDSLDNGENAKPSDLYFTAGQQKFVSMARTILAEATVSELRARHRIGLALPQQSRLAHVGLDRRPPARPQRGRSVTESQAKQSRRRGTGGLGSEQIPLLRLAARNPHPRAARAAGNEGEFAWPLWTVPATARSVASMLAQVAAPDAGGRGDSGRRVGWYRAWGLSRVMQSQIRRSSQGGYGTFGPPRVVWQRE